MNAMLAFAVEDLAAIMRALDAAGWDGILVGGQAVNVWACHYDRDTEEWRSLRPYNSRDLDYHGGLAEARRAMTVLKARGRLNTSMEPSPNAGVLSVQIPDGRELLIDILTGLFGLSSAEVERTAVRLSGPGLLSGLTLRVIHPLLLLEGKAASLRGLSQGDRQDAKHLRILSLVLREWLQEQLARPRDVFRAIERLAACACGPDGLNAFVHGIDLWQAVAWDVLRNRPEFAEFFQHRWPQLNDKLATKRDRHFQSLHPNHDSDDVT